MKDSIKVVFEIFIIGIIVWLINQFLIQICFVQGVSMYPTLKEGNLVFIKKFDSGFD